MRKYSKKFISISKQKIENQISNLVRTADFSKTFSKSDSTNCSCELYAKIKELHDTFLSYRIKVSPETYIENLFKPKELTLDEDNQVMKKLNFCQ